MWAMLKKFINSTVGNKNSKSLDEIIETELYNNYYEISNSAYGSYSNSLIVPLGVQDIYQTDYYDKRDTITRVVLPITLTALHYKAFGDFSKLKTIVVPKNVNEIDESVFSNCSELEYVDIRRKGNILIDLSFKSCPLLKTVIIRSQKPTFLYGDGDIFVACDALKDIYVGWGKGEVEGAPWGAPSKATIHYNLEGL